jgi:hypothetical protein
MLSLADESRIADLHHLIADTDPDPAFHFNADPYHDPH